MVAVAYCSRKREINGVVAVVVVVLRKRCDIVVIVWSSSFVWRWRALSF
jgi:hypothetical protein